MGWEGGDPGEGYGRNTPLARDGLQQTMKGGRGIMHLSFFPCRICTAVPLISPLQNEISPIFFSQSCVFYTLGCTQRRT